MAAMNKPDREKTERSTGMNKPDRERTEQNTSRTNPEMTSTSTKFGSTSAGTNPQTDKSGNYTFRCADAGFNDCSWETRGSSPEEVLRNVEQHGRQQHHLANIDEDTRNKVRSKIHQAA